MSKIELVLLPNILKEVEEKLGIKLKRKGTEEIKWRLAPDWEEKKVKAIVVEAPEELAYKIFENFEVKILRKVFD